MFDSQVNRLKQKFEDICGVISQKQLDSFMNREKWNDDRLYEALLGNTKEFKTFCYSFCKTLMPGRVSSATYTAVVATLCKRFSVQYKVMAGFCLPLNNPRYNEEMKAFQEKKDQGKEHPVMATHMYLTIDGKDYEYYNGITENISHIDVVEVDV